MTPPLSEAEHQEIQDLLGAYALDAVDKETAEKIERHLDECVKCAVEVSQHHEVAGLLANSGGQSPAELWERIESRLDGEGPPSWERLASRLEPGTDDRSERRLTADADQPSGPTGQPGDVVPIADGRSRRRLALRLATVAAAAAAVVAVVLGVQVDHLHHQVSSLQSGPLSAAEQSALADPSTKKVRLTPGVPSAGHAQVAAVTVVLTRSGTGFVEAGGLTSLPNDQTYQLWGVIGDRTISLGLLGSHPGITPFSVAGNADVSAFAITAERAGGVEHSSHQPVVAGDVITA